MAQVSYIASHRQVQNSYQRIWHFHDSNEILFSLNDDCSFFLDDQVYNIHRGALILIPEGTTHRKINPTDLAVNSYTIHYPSSLLEMYSTAQTDLGRFFDKRAVCIQLPEEAIDETVPYFERCLEEAGNGFGGDVRRNLRFVDLLLHLYPYLAADSGTKVRANGSPLVSNLIHYINEHLDEKLSLDRLASSFFVSKFNLCRQFKSETGFTVVEYINSNRVRRACTLLRQQKEVSAIASQVGFSNVSHFIHTFRQYTGMTPGQYQARYRNYTDVPFFRIFAPQDSGEQLQKRTS